MNTTDRVETLSFVRTTNPDTMQLEISCGHCGRILAKLNPNEILVRMDACREGIKQSAETHMKESPRCVKMKLRRVE